MNTGRALVDLVHVRDVVDGLVLAAGLPATPPDVSDGPPVYALSSGRPLTLRGLVEVLGSVAGRPVPVEWDVRPDREGDMLEPWDAGPAVPGWAPAVALPDGLRELLDEAAGG
jgi:nucleoside-diphosphate-sugar epimerase